MSISYHFLVALRLAIKARFIGMAIGILLVVALAMLLSAFFGGRQSSTVALDVGISTMRLLLPLLVVLLVQELLSREFDRRYYLNSLTYPNARSGLLLGRFLAVYVLAVSVLFVLGLLQVVLAEFIFKFYPQATPVVLGKSYLIVMAFFSVDLLVLTAFSVFFALFASSPSFVLIGTFGFMLVMRSYSSIVELLGQNAGLVGDAESYRASIGLLGYFLPDLGALDVRMIALYGKFEFLPSDWLWLLLGCLVYAFSILGLAVWLLQCKRFV